MDRLSTSADHLTPDVTDGGRSTQTTAGQGTLDLKLDYRATVRKGERLSSSEVENRRYDCVEI